MTLRQMKFFVEICEQGSISKASQTLLLSQQGISKAIKELEYELGCELLSRSSRGIALTKYGAYVLEEFKAILRKTDFITNNIENMKRTPHEVLNVGMAYGMISSLPASFLPDFMKKFPDIELIYRDYVDLQLEGALNAGQCDLAITTGFVNANMFDTELLGRERVFLCIPNVHEFFGRNDITMDELREQKFLMFDFEFNIARGFINSCRYAGFEPRTTYISRDFNSLKELAGITNGLFVVPEHTIRENDNLFSYCPFPDKYYTWDIYFAVRRGKLITETIQMFKQELIRHCYSDRRFFVNLAT